MKLRLSLIILLLPLWMHSQIKTYDQGHFYYIPLVEDEYKITVDSIHKLPETIIPKIDLILNYAIGKYQKVLCFKRAIIYNVDKFYIDNPSILNRRGVIPSYVLLFNWKDISLGVSNYEIYLCLDKFGQIINSNFPIGIDLDDLNLESLDHAFSRVDSLIQSDTIKFIEPEIKLTFDRRRNDMVWNFYYTQKLESGVRKTRSFEVYMLYKVLREVSDYHFTLGELEDVQLEEEVIEIRDTKINKP